MSQLPALSLAVRMKNAIAAAGAFAPAAVACFMALAAQAQDAPPAQAQSAELSPMLSRCVGKAGGDVRQGDPAFMAIALDGRPWTTIERTETDVGTQPISTTITGNGWRQRRDGTSVPFRFTCVLDERGQAMMFHASGLLRDLGDRLPPSMVIAGAASYPDKAPLPRGVELQIQLLDGSQQPPRILAEQVVRSGWLVPIAFALRLPAETSLADRNLYVSARLVLAHRTLFELAQPQAVTAKDLQKFLALPLVKAASSDR